MHIFTCQLIARLMQFDVGWNIELMTKRFVVVKKLSDTIDAEWNDQRYIVMRSDDLLFKKPLLAARLTIRNLLSRGPRVTIQKVIERFS